MTPVAIESSSAQSLRCIALSASVRASGRKNSGGGASNTPMKNEAVATGAVVAAMLARRSCTAGAYDFAQ